MATNTSALKAFAQETRKKLISLITTKMQFVLGVDTAELRGYEREIGELRKQIQAKTEKVVIEEVAYTWFNRVMALRFMDANGYNAPMVVTPAAGQTRPEILQDAMGGTVDDELVLTAEEKMLPEARLYRKLLVAVCNKQMSQPMPFLFEHLSTYTELLLPDDLLSDQSFVSDIRRGMTDEDCQNVELMGWLYQFYITDRKADAETKKSKKGGLKSDEQAAATQLFTPHWIVRYMVENSLGRIWMALHPESHLVDDMPYYIPTPEGQTDTIPEDIHQAKDIRFIDPCMGSGHILVYAFDLFAKMYEEEGQMTRDIPTLILQNNLFGIDIDRRCYQLASFALTMKGRAYYSRYLRKVVDPNVIALQPIDHDTIDASGSWGQKSLMWQFENIDTIGSLLKVTPEECAAIHVEEGLFGYNQQILKTQAEYLSRKYHCVVTNPPYLGKGIGDSLKKYIVCYYPDSKYDTMATFMERALEMCVCQGKCAMINMHSWMFISSYANLRAKILKNFNIDSLLHLGTRTFDEIGGEVVQNASFVISNSTPSSGSYYRLIEGRNSSEKERLFLINNRKNHSSLRFDSIKQNIYNKISGSPLCYWISDNLLKVFSFSKSFDKIGAARQGLATGDNDRFLRLWFEIGFDKFKDDAESVDNALSSGYKWFPHNKGGYQKWFGNQEFVIAFDKENYDALLNMGNHLPSRHLYFKPCVSWGVISTTQATFRYYPQGTIFNMCGMGFFHNDENVLMKALGYSNSKLFNKLQNIINPTLNLSNGDFGRIPYCDISDDSIQLIKNNIAISKSDWDAHETSWDFQRNPLWEQQHDTILYYMQEQGVIPEDATIDDIGPFNLTDLLQPLEILVENYQSEWEARFHQLHRNEEKLNRKFIEIYGLQDELTPDVPLDEITILQKGEISIEDNRIVWYKDVIIKQFISWLVGCLMGRYSADKPGLIIASQGQKVPDLDLKKQTIEIDDDGIIPVIMEEDFFADDMTQRIEAAVKALFGEKYFHNNMKFIRTAIGMPLRDYLYKNFYADHQQMYSVKGAKRPIYWLFNSAMGDKRKKGYFKALVYMHRLEADTLSKLHADYVHPYIQKIEQQLVEAEDNALREDLTGKQKKNALDLAETLRDKVREVKAFETTLVEMASARITIDLDDGVKANYPKFYPLVEPIKGLDAND